MPLEDVGAVEALLRCAARAWAEAAYHGALVVGKSVPVLVVLPCKAFGVVLARRDRALLWSLVLVGEHVCLQVLEVSAA